MNIFVIICNYNAGKHLSDCLDSVERNLDEDVHVSVADNCSRDDGPEVIGSRKWVDQRMLLAKNEGKAVAMNALVRNLTGTIGDDDLVMSLDSDISLVTGGFFRRSREIWAVLSGKVCNMVCTQTGNSLFRRSLEFQRYAPGNFHYFADPLRIGVGIAGGAMFIPYRHWRKVGGYREDRGPNGGPAIYGGNDGNLNAMLARSTGLPVCVVKELEVHHPPEGNRKYQAWKDMVHEEHRRLGRAATSRGFFD